MDAKVQELFRLGEVKVIMNLISEVLKFPVPQSNLPEHLYNHSGQHTIKRYNNYPVID
jgi:hypothetical protein